MEKLKIAVVSVLVAALGAVGGHLATPVTESPIKCSTARHLTECEECQNVTSNVVLFKVDQARKASTAPVVSK